MLPEGDPTTVLARARSQYRAQVAAYEEDRCASAEKERLEQRLRTAALAREVLGAELVDAVIAENGSFTFEGMTFERHGYHELRVLWPCPGCGVPKIPSTDFRNLLDLGQILETEPRAYPHEPLCYRCREAAQQRDEDGELAAAAPAPPVPTLEEHLGRVLVALIRREIPDTSWVEGTIENIESGHRRAIERAEQRASDLQRKVDSLDTDVYQLRRAR